MIESKFFLYAFEAPNLHPALAVDMVAKPPMAAMHSSALTVLTALPYATGPKGLTINMSNLVIQAVTFLGGLSDPFKGLSDLQLGDEKVTT